MTDNPSNGPSGSADGAAQTPPKQRLELQKVYLKDVSLETPNSPKIFTEQWKPELQVEIHSNAKPLSDDVFEVAITLTLTAKQGEQTGYLIELQQAGVFTAVGFETPQLNQLLGAYCPNMLFPYAREAVDNLLVKGGFPPLHLAPINFDALYQQHLQAQREQQRGAEH